MSVTYRPAEPSSPKAGRAAARLGRSVVLCFRAEIGRWFDDGVYGEVCEEER